jgi:hypothetical protein
VVLPFVNMSGDPQQEYLQLEPDHTVENIRGRLPARNPATVEIFIDALCDAGLPR